MSKETRKRLAVALLATILVIAALPIAAALLNKIWSLIG
jgi:hypothetical protein